MSLMLKGIDLPKEGELRLIINKNGMICGAEYPKVRHTYPLNLDAEAIQIPTPHGRIVDVKELEKDGSIAWKVALAPTILEEEK